MTSYPSPPALPQVRFSSDYTHSRAPHAPGELMIMRGVLLTPSPNLPPWRQKQEVTLARCLGAMHSIPSALALTHEAAALVHGHCCRAQEPDIRLAVSSRPSPTRRRLPQVRYAAKDQHVNGRLVSMVRSTVRPAPEEIEVVSGLAVSSSLRTALDCAFDLPVHQSVCVMDSVLREVCLPSRWTGQCLGQQPDAVRAVLLEQVEAQGKRNGKRRARAAVALGAPFSESPGESVLRWAIAAARLPRPELQHRWESRSSASTYYIDLAWPHFQIALEFDGYSKYGVADDLRAEKRREMELVREGWRVHRFDWSDLRNHAALVARLRSIAPARLERRPTVRDLWR